MLSRFNLLLSHILCLLMAIKIAEFYPEKERANNTMKIGMVICIALDIFAILTALLA